MNVAFISQAISGGGSERVTVNLVNGFCKKEGICAYLISGREKDKEYLLDERVTRYCIIGNSLLGNVVAIRRCILENKIDVIVGMGIYANFCVCLAKKRNVHVKYIISERNSPKHDRLSLKTKLLRFLLYRRADGVVFQTREAMEFYSFRIQRRGVVIHNPVKDNLPKKSEKNRQEIVAVGRLQSQKNYPMLLKAFAIVQEMYPEYMLRIFGVGAELQKLQQLAIMLGIGKKVLFEGFYTNVHEQIRDSEIYVLSSDYEGMPNALMEAMAMGFPVVSTDCPCGGPRELIEDGVNGLLSPVGDEVVFADNIMRLISDETYRKKLADEARKILQTHSESVIVEKWYEFLVS